MIDLYYLTEQPLPADWRVIARLIRLRDHGAEIEAVLSEFFKLTEEGWRHARCDAELSKMQDKQAKARASAAASVAARSTNAQRALNERSTDVQLPTPTPTPTPKESPISPQGGKRPGAVSLKAWLESIKAAGEKPIPDGDAVFAYADEVKLPYDFLRLAWLEFRHRYGQPDAKRYRDWRGVFRKAVRGNWLKLWWLDPGSNAYGLTTVGLQAQRAHAEKGAA